nr:FAD-dependent monooxygenase [Streptomyces sp. NBRC 110611]
MNHPPDGTTGTTHGTDHPTHHDTAPPAHDADVLVVGAGPTGLLLAGDLARAGLAVTLLERRASTVGNLTRALAVHARTLEQLDARGLADELVDGGHPVTRPRMFGSVSLDLSRLPTRFPFVLITPQYEVERVLERRAREAGVTFRHSCEVLGLEQDADGVTVRMRTTGDSPASGDAAESGGGAQRSSSIRATYLVGTDGVHSTVREAVGLPFPGKSVLRSVALADVRLDRKPESPLLLAATDDAFALIGSFGDGWYRVIGSLRRRADDSAPDDLAEIREAVRLVFGSDYGMHDARWVSRFHSDERQVPAYRVGRVFLAGDAAHVHSPAGGQGMNTGLQDAANLGWKLAAVLQGHAPETLLDSYHTERHPVGRQVLRSSGAILRIALLHGARGRAARALAAQLLSRLRPASRRAVRTVSGLGIGYPAGPGAHRLAGRRAPDIHLADGSRLYELLRHGTFVLITPDGEPGLPQPPAHPGADSRQHHDATARTARTARTLHAAWRGDRRTAVLVRPDGYIAWATDATAPEERAAALRTALRHWTGSAHSTPATGLRGAPESVGATGPVGTPGSVGATGPVDEGRLIGPASAAVIPAPGHGADTPAGR